MHGNLRTIVIAVVLTAALRAQDIPQVVTVACDAPPTYADGGRFTYADVQTGARLCSDIPGVARNAMLTNAQYGPSPGAQGRGGSPASTQPFAGNLSEALRWHLTQLVRSWVIQQGQFLGWQIK